MNRARLARLRSPRIDLIILLPRVHAGLTAAATALACCQAAVAVSLAFALGAVAGTLHDSSQGRLLLWIVVLGGLFVFQYTLVSLLDYVVGRLGRKTEGYLHERLMKAMLAPVGIAHTEDPRVHEFRREAQGIGDGQYTPSGAVAGTFRNFGTWLTALALSVVVALFSWPLALLLTGFLIVVRRLLARQMSCNAQHTTGSTEDLRRADYYRDLSLTTPAAKELRIFGLSEWVLGRFSRHWTTAMEEVWRDRRNQSLRPWTWSLPWGALMFAVFMVTALAVVHGELTIAAAIRTIQASLGAASVWITTYDDVQVAYGAAAVPALLRLERQLAPSGTVGRAAAVAPRAADISFERVSFSYPDAGREVLSELTLTIPVGRTTAIVGHNGAGKTTLIKLLTRMYEPVSGRITVGGIDLRDVPVSDWRRQVAVVFQDFVRYKLSAADNVGFGRLELAADVVALDAVAGKVRVADVIAELESGWATVLSKDFPGGTDLSGGEWQRIALARALLAVEGGAGILVLDEPTANLDVRAERILFDQLIRETRGVTTVLISHRFSTVRRADLICVLADGAVAELGSHDELLREQGLYARMYRIQAARFTDTGKGAAV